MRTTSATSLSAPVEESATTMLGLWCCVYGENAPFRVEIERDATVAALQRAIVLEKKGINERFHVDPAEIALYLARTDGGWLDEGEQSDASEAAHTKYARMLASHPLSRSFDDTFRPQPGYVHVLMELPPSAEERAEQRAAKRKRDEVGEATPLSELWGRIEWQHTVLPHPHQLKELLSQPLPFQVALGGSVDTSKIFTPNAELINCSPLAAFLGAYLALCERPPAANASEALWQYFYDSLLQIPLSVCAAKGLMLEKIRNSIDPTGATHSRKRPDCLLMDRGVILLRGEENSEDVAMDDSLRVLTSKMRQWNVALYGDLPYLLAYATSGRAVDLVAIERSNSLRCTPILSLDILTNKEATIKTFFNLAMLLYEMASLPRRHYPVRLQPFTKSINEKRTIELMDNVVVRTITQEQRGGLKEFNRIANVYSTLAKINSLTQIHTPNLQSVEKYKKEGHLQLVVYLAPVGYGRLPEAHEVKQWLNDLLTALKHWHKTGYCHGDVQWRNIVFVPDRCDGGAGGGHWMLIDMDESRKHDTTIITWNHKWGGEKLRFQHDLFQLGKLMKSFWFELPQPLEEMQKFLVEAVGRPEITAADALTRLGYE